MKKSIKLLATLSSLFVGSSTFALECSDSYGTWHGDLGSLTSVALTIHQPDPMEGASISFEQDGGSTEFGLLTTNCSKNPDGSLTITFNRNSWGINSSGKATMVSSNTLIVNSFTYSMMYDNGSGSGTLTK